MMVIFSTSIIFTIAEVSELNRLCNILNMLVGSKLVCYVFFLASNIDVYISTCQVEHSRSIPETGWAWAIQFELSQLDKHQRKGWSLQLYFN